MIRRILSSHRPGGRWTRLRPAFFGALLLACGPLTRCWDTYPIPPEPVATLSCVQGEQAKLTGRHVPFESTAQLALSEWTPVYPAWHYQVRVEGCQSQNGVCLADANGTTSQLSGAPGEKPFPDERDLLVLGQYSHRHPWFFETAPVLYDPFIIGTSADPTDAATDELPPREAPSRLTFKLNWPADQPQPGVSNHQVQITKYVPERLCHRTPPGAQQADWLWTAGPHIYTSDGFRWRARGANLHDTRSCERCSFSKPDPGEVIERARILIEDWNATFIRLALESYYDEQSVGRTQSQGVIEDAVYRGHVEQIVKWITDQKVYVLLSLWKDDSIERDDSKDGTNGRPTDRTVTVWRDLSASFLKNPWVLFGVVSEPQDNEDGAFDEHVRDRMQAVVDGIRAVEDAAGTPHHIIAVQGPGMWARRISAYTKPNMQIVSDNIVYEVHAYRKQSEFEDLWKSTARQLPVVIGEFGPDEENSDMTEADAVALMREAEALDVPYLAWTFHQACPPNLIAINDKGSCLSGLPIAATLWGEKLVARLALPWGSP